MIWPFPPKKRAPSSELKAARAAEQRAVDTIRQVSDRTGEVNVYYNNLRRRRKKNNFGPALQEAMQRALAEPQAGGH